MSTTSTENVVQLEDAVAARKAKKAAADKARRDRKKQEKDLAQLANVINDGVAETSPAPAEETPAEETPAEETPKPAKKAKRPELAYKPKLLLGLHRTNWNKKRGTWVSVYDGEKAKMDTAGGRWQVVCEKHSTVNSVDTAATARKDAQSDPAEFCEACRG